MKYGHESNAELTTEVLGDQLVVSWVAIQIMLIVETNFTFKPIRIRIEIAEIRHFWETSWWLAHLVGLPWFNILDSFIVFFMPLVKWYGQMVFFPAQKRIIKINLKSIFYKRCHKLQKFISNFGCEKDMQCLMPKQIKLTYFL